MLVAIGVLEIGKQTFGKVKGKDVQKDSGVGVIGYVLAIEGE